MSTTHTQALVYIVNKKQSLKSKVNCHEASTDHDMTWMTKDTWNIKYGTLG